MVLLTRKIKERIMERKINRNSLKRILLKAIHSLYFKDAIHRNHKKTMMKNKLKAFLFWTVLKNSRVKKRQA